MTVRMPRRSETAQCVEPARAAECEESVVARVAPPLDGHDVDALHDVDVRQLEDPGCRVLETQAQWAPDLLRDRPVRAASTSSWMEPPTRYGEMRPRAM